MVDSSQQPADIMVDRQADRAEASQTCNYKEVEDTVWRCGEDYRLVVEMSDGHDSCPSYYLLQKTGQAYPLLETLLADNGCDPTCHWEPGLWENANACGQTNYLVQYGSHFLNCPPLEIWSSSVTGGFYASHEEAKATLPVCPDGESPRGAKRPRSRGDPARRRGGREG